MPSYIESIEIDTDCFMQHFHCTGNTYFTIPVFLALSTPSLLPKVSCVLYLLVPLSVTSHWNKHSTHTLRLFPSFSFGTLLVSFRTRCSHGFLQNTLYSHLPKSPKLGEFPVILEEYTSCDAELPSEHD